jgi:NTP pyrophosphatase (non-canonical NTP hydrolase)
MAYKITSQDLPGLAKLAEECSEVSQAVAKIMGGCDTAEQFLHLEEEMGDVYAALRFFIDNNTSEITWSRIAERANEKSTRWDTKRARRFAQNGRKV